MDIWNAPVVQSRKPLTYRLMERVWEAQDDMDADYGEELHRVEALMIDILGDFVLDLQCAQQTSYLEGDMDVAPVPAH